MPLPTKLRELGAKVVYLKDLVLESIGDGNVHEMLIRDFGRGGASQPGTTRTAWQIFSAACPFPDAGPDDRRYPQERAQGGCFPPPHRSAGGSLPVCADPMPNMYFSRDAFFFVDGGVAISKMNQGARMRENLFAQYIFTYPQLRHLRRWYERGARYSLGGGRCPGPQPQVWRWGSLPAHSPKPSSPLLRILGA